MRDKFEAETGAGGTEARSLIQNATSIVNEPNESQAAFLMGSCGANPQPAVLILELARWVTCHEHVSAKVSAQRHFI